MTYVQTSPTSLNSLTVQNGISNELENSIEKLTAESVVGRLFYEIDRIAEPDEVSGDWLNQMLSVIQFSQEIEIGFGHAKAYALAVIKKHWEELPLPLRKQYDFQFLVFARQVTGRERSTIDNYIATAEIWFIQKLKPEGTIPVKVRDLTGRPVVNETTGEIRTKSVDFSPYTVDLSKLLQVNSVARQGKMTDQLWELLVDPYYSCDDLRAAMRGPGSLVDDEFYYFVEGPGLFVRCNGMAICLSEEMNWAGYYVDDTVKEAMDKFFSMLGVDLNAEEERLYAVSHAKVDQGYIA